MTDISVQTSGDELLEEKKETLSEEELERRQEAAAKLRIRWSRVLILALILSVIFIGINWLVFWILLRNGFVLNLPLALLIECGILLIVGGCLGTIKQSFMINRLKIRVFKGEKITMADTKIALGSAYTYILLGVFVGIASGIFWSLWKNIIENIVLT